MKINFNSDWLLKDYHDVELIHNCGHAKITRRLYRKEHWGAISNKDTHQWRYSTKCFGCQEKCPEEVIRWFEMYCLANKVKM